MAQTNQLWFDFNLFFEDIKNNQVTHRRTQQ